MQKTKILFQANRRTPYVHYILSTTQNHDSFFTLVIVTVDLSFYSFFLASADENHSFDHQSSMADLRDKQTKQVYLVRLFYFRETWTYVFG